MFRSEFLRVLSLFTPLIVALLLGCGGGGGDGTGTGGGSGGGVGGTGTTGVNDAQVKVLATGLRFPYNTVVDATNVYWNDAETGAISSVPIAGGSATALVPAGAAAGIDLAQDATNIYFTLNNFTLRRVAKTGGAAATLTDSNTRYPGCSGTLCGLIPSGVIVSGGKVIFGNSTSGNGSSSGTGPSMVLSIDPAGTGLTNVTTANAGSTTAWVVLSAGANSLYFANEGDISSNAVKSVALGGGSASSLLSIQGGMSSLLAPTTGAGAGTVFYSGRALGSNNQRLYKITGGSATVMAAVIVQSSRSLAADDENIYYPKLDEDSGGSLIAKMSLSTGAETILAGASKTDGVAGGLSVDGSNVYWAAPGAGANSGSIRSVPK